MDHLIKAKEAAENAARVAEIQQVIASPSVTHRTGRQRTLPSEGHASLAPVPAPQTIPRSLMAGAPEGDVSQRGLSPPLAQSLMVMNVTNIPQPHERALRADLSLPALQGRMEILDSAKRSAAVVQTMPHLQNAMDSESEDELLHHLERCANAVAQLSSQIEWATHRWQAGQRYKRHGLTPAFHATHKAMKKLWAFEADLDLCQDSDSGSSPDVGMGERRPNTRLPRRGATTRTATTTTTTTTTMGKRPASDAALAECTATDGRRKFMQSRSRSRSWTRDYRLQRSRRYGSWSRSHSISRSPWRHGTEYQDRRIAQAGLASASAVGIFAHRSRSRGRATSRRRSRSQVRTGSPIAAAGLGSAALAGLYEKKKVEQEAKEAAMVEELDDLSKRMRSRSRGRCDSAPYVVDRRNIYERAYDGDPPYRIEYYSRDDEPNGFYCRTIRRVNSARGSLDQRKRSSSQSSNEAIDADADAEREVHWRYQVDTHFIRDRSESNERIQDDDCWPAMAASAGARPPMDDGRTQSTRLLPGLTTTTTSTSWKQDGAGLIALDLAHHADPALEEELSRRERDLRKFEVVHAGSAAANAAGIYKKDGSISWRRATSRGRSDSRVRAGISVVNTGPGVRSSSLLHGLRRTRMTETAAVPEVNVWNEAPSEPDASLRASSDLHPLVSSYDVKEAILELNVMPYPPSPQSEDSENQNPIKSRTRMFSQTSPVAHIPGSGSQASHWPMEDAETFGDEHWKTTNPQDTQGDFSAVNELLRDWTKLDT